MIVAVESPFTVLLVALALVFVIEGILPFLAPDAIRRALEAGAQLDNASMRLLGLMSMLGGLLMLYLVH